MGTNPCKKTKSPIVGLFSTFLFVTKQTTEQRTTFMEKQAAMDQEDKKQRMLKLEEKQEKKKMELQMVKDMALEAGVGKGSVEFYAIGYLCKDEEMKRMFMELDTTQERVRFLKRFCWDYNLE